ncbi:hypothetical protein SAMN02746041_01979 [Desulfacinum hydrothermale DSM 13146]|uniref:Uncharacterized protein n=1 Tax=Desulfacinum hydrothermale DSM 13146 TaxID=1121390 RepID=A0A1W1XKQ4_9BACT|nr:hypothetical protein [Desulfacinum hydrothermale]SMC24384.1 hypothetical protein SAMN02746041_01979 [Desulfacinum hydrothermale DSM 13146]
MNGHDQMRQAFQSQYADRYRTPEPLVAIRLSLLNRLHRYQSALERHILAYMSIYQVQRLSDRARTRIEKGLQEEHRLEDAYYWEALRDLLQDAQRTIPYPCPDEPAESRVTWALDALMESQQKAVSAANDALTNPDGIEPGSTLRAVKWAVDEMLVHAEAALRESRKGAEEALAGIKACSERILERVEDQSRIPRRNVSEVTAPTGMRFKGAEVLLENRTDRNSASIVPEDPSRRRSNAFGVFRTS